MNACVKSCYASMKLLYFIAKTDAFVLYLSSEVHRDKLSW